MARRAQNIRHPWLAQHSAPNLHTKPAPAVMTVLLIFGGFVVLAIMFLAVFALLIKRTGNAPGGGEE